jgi:hypothetical protein
MALFGGELDVACPSVDSRRRDAQASGNHPYGESVFASKAPRVRSLGCVSWGACGGEHVFA